MNDKKILIPDEVRDYMNKYEVDINNGFHENIKNSSTPDREGPITVYLGGKASIYFYEVFARPGEDVDVFTKEDLTDCCQENVGYCGHRFAWGEISDRKGDFEFGKVLLHKDIFVDSFVITDNEDMPVRMRVPSAVDLAVSKIVRFDDDDREDIAKIIRRGFADVDAIENRAKSALMEYDGDIELAQSKLNDMIAWARTVESEIKVQHRSPKM